MRRVHQCVRRIEFRGLECGAAGTISRNREKGKRGLLANTYVYKMVKEVISRDASFVWVETITVVRHVALLCNSSICKLERLTFSTSRSTVSVMKSWTS